MKATVNFITKSKSGKAWRVTMSNGRIYGANFDSKIDTHLGKPIDFEFDDGKFGLWITSWGPDTSTPAPQAPAASPGQSSGHPLPGERYWLAFVSN